MPTIIRKPRPAVKSAAFHSGPPVAPRREALSRRPRAFGAGLGERCPVHRAPADLDSMAWWEAQNAREDETWIDRRFAEIQAEERMSSGLDF